MTKSKQETPVPQLCYENLVRLCGSSKSFHIYPQAKSVRIEYVDKSKRGAEVEFVTLSVRQMRFTKYASVDGVKNAVFIKCDGTVGRQNERFFVIEWLTWNAIVALHAVAKDFSDGGPRHRTPRRPKPPVPEKQSMPAPLPKKPAKAK